MVGIGFEKSLDIRTISGDDLGHLFNKAARRCLFDFRILKIDPPGVSFLSDFVPKLGRFNMVALKPGL